MNRVMPYPLWIGHGGEGLNVAQLFELGIEAVVELSAEEPSLALHRSLIACRFPLLDGAGNRAELLALAIRTVASLVKAGIPTLVCCSGGVSRSPAVVAAALALVNHQLPEESLKHVAITHHSDVAPGLWREIIRLPSDLYELGRLR